MTTIAAGATGSYTFTTNDSVSVSLDPGGIAQISVTSGAQKFSKLLTNAEGFGPMAVGAVMSITAIRGSVVYTIVSAEAFATQATLTADQTALGATNAGLTPDGRIVDTQGNVIVPVATRGNTLGLWWTGLTNATQSGLADRRANVLFTNNANGGSVITLGGTQAFQFNGAGFLQTASTYFQTLQRAIFRLDTLGYDDMIVVWMILTHPTAVASRSLFYWGRNSDQGWGLSTNGATGKLVFDHVPQGGSRDQHTLDLANALVGDNSLNTKTALAISVTRSVSDIGNYGAGNGLFHVETCKQGLFDQGPFGQLNFSVSHPRRVPSGTAPAKYSDAGLSIGARPTSSSSTVTDTLAATFGMDNIGAFRIKRRHGLVCKITRELQAAYLLNQHQYTLPPSMAA